MGTKSQKVKSYLPKKNNPRHSRRDSSNRNMAEDNIWTFYKLCGLVGIVSVVAWFLYYGYLETRINTPFASLKVTQQNGIDIPDRYWGTYRPGLYFGTQVRHPVSPVTGLMWFTSGHFENNMIALRHWCDQGDNLVDYGWKAHDGRSFGNQMIRDKTIDIETSFVKHPGGDDGGDWSARIKVSPKVGKSAQKEVSLFYYIALNKDDKIGRLDVMNEYDETLAVIEGKAEALGEFQLSIHRVSGTLLRKSKLVTKHDGFDVLKETMIRGLRLVDNERYIALAGDLFDPEDSDKSPNFIVYQVTGVSPFEIDVVFESKSFITREVSLTGDILTERIEQLEKKFKDDFELMFNLRSKGFSDGEIKFAEAALSNMVGGIGYFYGASKVQGKNNKDPVPYWKAPLYTGVPSRSFFPRGFLWDEGFHNLLISKWDMEISMDILGHWFDLMNWDGWIPREQILGAEAQARVPEEFVIQSMDVANPPTLILTLHEMIGRFKNFALSDEKFEYLNRLWPRLKGWYNWFNSTQFGNEPSTYRWRGRDSKAVRELNPRTLASGLDDYPRASHPSVDERHLDLRCWMTLASSLMADIATLIEKDATKYKDTFKYFSDNNLLDSLHWSYSANGYMDFGLHTDNVILKRLNPKSEKVRVVLSEPTLRHIDSFGYISFFPLFLRIISPQSPKLKRVLEDLRRTDLLWTPYGLRSLAKNSPFYNKHNTENDPPYWRGSIWINMNFLAVRSLHYYSQAPGSNGELAFKIYKELRKNVINNVMKEYNRTGYIWEHYNDKTGHGEGCRPFTGWSALTVLMMGETY